MAVKELREAWQKALQQAKAIADAAEAAQRDFTAEERQKVTGFIEEAKGLKAQIKAAEGDDALRKAIKELGEGFQMGQSVPSPTFDGQQIAVPKGMTLGEAFVNNPAYVQWLKALGGRVPDKGGFQSPSFQTKGLMRFGQKELITGLSDVSAGAFVQTDYTGIYEPLGRRPLTIRDLVTRRTTTSDIVEFVRQTRVVQEAAPVPEANVKEYTGATGEISGAKPQGEMAFEIAHEVVKNIAVWVGATRRALSDVGQLRGIIDDELNADLQEEFEDQILTGDGIGENFTGLANQAGTLIQAFNTNVLITTRQALTTVQTVGRAQPTAWVFNPVDWEGIELGTDLVGQFYGGGPFGITAPRLWGVPVVQSQGWAAGTCWLGDWRKAVVWDREQAQIYTTDSHADFFVRNIIAILAEMRAAFGLRRPQAFVNVALA